MHFHLFCVLTAPSTFNSVPPPLLSQLHYFPCGVLLVFSIQLNFHVASRSTKKTSSTNVVEVLPHSHTWNDDYKVNGKNSLLRSTLPSFSRLKKKKSWRKKKKAGEISLPQTTRERHFHSHKEEISRLDWTIFIWKVMRRALERGMFHKRIFPFKR